MIEYLQDLSIADMFKAVGGKDNFFTIPQYQRVYKWKEDRWGDLFFDVLNNGNKYFLGCIIFIIKEKIKGSNSYKLELVDGQQRITTISILLLAIYNFLKNETVCKNTLDEIRNLLVMKDNRGKYASAKLVLQKEGFNQSDYYSLLINEGLLQKNDHRDENNAGNRQIYRVFRFFQSQLENSSTAAVANKEAKTKIDFVLKFYKKLKTAILVHIGVKSDTDAYILFESLNYKKEDLSIIDLLKNKLMSKVDNNDENYNSEKISNYWGTLMQDLGNNSDVQERFFRQYYNAFIEDINPPAVDKNNKRKYKYGPLATKSSLITIFTKLINDNYKDLIEDVLSKSGVYSQLINNRSTQEVLTQPLKDLEHIQGAPSYLLLLYLMCKMDELKITYDQIAEIVKLLVRFFVRRNLTDIPATRDLNKIFMDLSNEVSQCSGDEVIQIIKEKLILCSASDEDFRKKLEGNVYRENKETTRFLLCYYEKAHATKDNPRDDLWEKDDKNKPKFTIEHIFPEGENIPSHWVDMIAKGDILLAKKYLETYCHVLGNLTLTSYNSKLSNSRFDLKRDMKDKNGNPIGFKNGLKLNEDVGNKRQWTINNIKTRKAKLVGWFVQNLKL